MYAPGVLWTAAHHRIPLLNVMHNNRGYHQEVMHVQRMADRRNRVLSDGPVGTQIIGPDIDYAKLAQSMGWWASGPIADAGWAWGAQFGDLNNDGRNELFVANGFISADPHRTYWYDMSKVAGANRNVFQDAGNWPPIGTASLSGYERSRVFVHAGEIGWVDVARKVGIMDQYDGRAVALADLENRGALDVIVANQNQPALVYRALPEPGNHWIAFKLVATRSNRSAIGTEVVIEFGGEKQRRIVDGGMGFASQNDRRLHFGLGNRTNVDRVTVYWPSGTIQVVRGLAADQFHQITEPVP